MTDPSPTRGIGALADASGCKVETIRYYEKIGVMPAPPRTRGGHRFYTHDHVKRLVFIRRCRGLGFGIDEIRELLGLVDGGDATCGQVREIVARHLAEVRRRLADLRAMQRMLAAAAAECEAGTPPACPVIDAVYGAGERA